MKFGMFLTAVAVSVFSMASEASEQRYLQCTMQFGQTSTQGSLYRITGTASSDGNFENVSVTSWESVGAYHRKLASGGRLISVGARGTGVVYAFLPDQNLLRLSFPSNFSTESKRHQFDGVLTIDDKAKQKTYQDVRVFCSLKTFAEMNN